MREQISAEFNDGIFCALMEMALQGFHEDQITSIMEAMAFTENEVIEACEHVGGDDSGDWPDYLKVVFDAWKGLDQ